jgi:acetyl-CoA synthetase
MRCFSAAGLVSRRSSTFVSKESRNFAEYTKEYDFSVKQPVAYWKAVGERYLTWDKPFTASFAGTMGHDLRYYVGGRLNASYNAVDRHVEKGLGEQRALIWEGDEPGETRDVTYNELSDGVNRFANLLRCVGVGAGDAVAIYMPPCPEAVFAMLGCARIGAVHAVVFAGFSAEALRARILHVGAKVVVTVDAMTRSGRTVPLKDNVDEALLACPDVRRVIVSQRTKDGNMVRGRDIALTDALSRQRPWCPPESFDSEHNLFVLYTSGSTGAPKGLVHTTAGYLAYAALTHQKLFDYRPGDIHACVADIGWITGHTYIVYGPLLNGATSLMFEGVPTHPGPDRYWDMVARHKISTFYTSPTALRAISKFGDSHVTKHDLSSLRVLGSVGEPLNAEVWRWYYRVVGQERCSIVDTYWQTETGGAIISPLANVTPMKPGSAALPFFGVEAVLMGADGKEVSDFEFSKFLPHSFFLRSGASRKGDGHSGAQVALAGPEPHGVGGSRQVSADLFHRISRLFLHR